MSGTYSTTLTELRSLAEELADKLHGLEQTPEGQVQSDLLDRVRRHAEVALEALGSPRPLAPGAPAPERAAAFRARELAGYDDELADALGRLFEVRSGLVFDDRGAIGIRSTVEEQGPPATATSPGTMRVKVNLDEKSAFDAAPGPAVGSPDFNGHTDAVSVPELIGFFQLQSKTGVLRIEAEHETFSLTYIGGELCRVTSSKSPAGQRLGELLVALGYLTDSRLQELLATSPSTMKIGEVLQQDGGLLPESISAALKLQVQGIFERLCDVGGSSFTFHAGTGTDTATQRRYNVTHLLLETARRKDESLHGQRQGLDLLEG